MKNLSNLYAYIPLAVGVDRADQVLISTLENFDLDNSQRIIVYNNLKNNISNGVITTTTKSASSNDRGSVIDGFTGFSEENQKGAFGKTQNDKTNTFNETITINNIQDDIDYLETIKFSLTKTLREELEKVLFKWILKLGEY